MVIPINSRHSSLFLGPPSDEALKVMPRLRAALCLVAIAMIAELTAAYSNEALASFCTVLVGRALLRDYRSWSFCLSSFLLICWTNAAVIAGLLFLICSGKAHIPSAGAFFATTCPRHDGKSDPCSWHTAVGNTAIAVSFIGHSLCGYFGLQLSRHMQRQATEQLMSFDSMEAMETGLLFHSLSQTRNEQGRSNEAQGITPYSGTGHQITPCTSQGETEGRDPGFDSQSAPPQATELVAFSGQAQRLD